MIRPRQRRNIEHC